jgi:hypothetical protein
MFYSPSCERLLLQNENSRWSAFPKLSNQRGKKKFSSVSVETGYALTIFQHGDLYPVDTEFTSDAYIILGNHSRDRADHLPILPTTPRSRNTENLGWIADVWFSRPTEERLSQIAAAIEEGTCTAVSDGSALENDQGTAAWCISNVSEFEIISGGLRVPGPDCSHCSYRSEMAGIYAILKTVWAICIDRGVTKGKVEVGSDSLSILERLFDSPCPATFSDHSWDLLSACQKLVKQLRQFLDISWRHIPGHQDDTIDPATLDIWAQRNIAMDLRATHIYTVIPKEEATPFREGTLWNLRIGGQNVVCNFQDTIRHATVGKAILDYWKKENKLGSKDIPIAWPSFGTAVKEVGTNRKRWIVKHTSGRCAVGVEMKRRKTWSHANCPRCTETQETSSHVLRCNGDGTKEIWDKFIGEFRLWLARQRTHNDISAAICSALTTWRSGIPAPQCRSSLPGLTSACDEQDDIGWDAAMEGRWAESWIKVQERHFKFLHLRRSGKRWLTEIIKQLWNVSWDLWDHRNQVNIENKTREQRLINCPNIRAEYNLGTEGLDRYDCRLFTKPLDNTLNLPLPKQDAWIRRITLARKRAASNALHIEQANLLSFFNTLARIGRRRPAMDIIQPTPPQPGVHAPVHHTIIRIPRFSSAETDVTQGISNLDNQIPYALG